jgi:polyphosphate kinase
MLISKEVSWLAFNERLLQEAEDKENPIGDRLNFLGIFSNNQDEFFRVRVGSLIRMLQFKSVFIQEEEIDPESILIQIKKTVKEQRERFDKIFNDLLEELEDQKIRIIRHNKLNSEQRNFIANYFFRRVRPKIFPMMLDKRFKIPRLKDKALYLAVEMSRKKGKMQYSIIEIPTKILPRFVLLPSESGTKDIILIDEIVRFGLPSIFKSMHTSSYHSYAIKVTRDAALDMDDDFSLSYVSKMNRSLSRRKQGKIVRFIHDANMPEELLTLLLKKLRLNDEVFISPGGRYHNFKDFMQFPTLAQLEREKRFPIIAHPAIDQKKNLIANLKKQDILLHFPYHSFEAIIDFLREASIDPKVESIKITLYRVAKFSSIINALINARRNRKDVTVVLELQARFDERANIFWAQKLQEEKVHVVFGVNGLKVHSKIGLISRREGSGLKYYSAIGTGNFNEDTAKLYTDSYLLTSDQEIGRDVAQVFQFLETSYAVGEYQHLYISPVHTRKRLTLAIQNEAALAAEGKDAFIWIKINNLADKRIIQELYNASAAGVQIRLIVRSMMSLAPQIEGLSENIEAISIVGPYLEHSRFYIFGNDGDERVFISSADLMPRNIDRRVEVTVPIYQKKLREEIVEMFRIYWKDNKKARVWDQHLRNQYRMGDGEDFNSQKEIFHFLSQAIK